MPYEKLKISTPASVLSWANHDLGSEETKMAKNVASLPFVFKHVALMPDVHLGKGALVGSVVATKDAIIPAAVGVDVGCGMNAIKTPFVARSPKFDAYWRDLQWAQEFARVNRDVMMVRFKRIVEKHLAGGKATKPLLSVNCHHNYAEKEVHFGEEVYVTRKGAVRAREDDYGIIPGSMGAKSFIVRGKGNHDSYCSCSHGAGRLMSRNKAKKHFSLDDLVEQTAGIECRKDEGVLDEIPGAYKPIDEVMANQSDLVEVVATLKQVICVKG